MPRETIDLSGSWRFQPDPYCSGAAAGYSSPEYDAGRWRTVQVPCGFDATHPMLGFYQGLAWYRRRVFVPAGWQGRRVVIRFEAVNHRAGVWVNGKQVASNPDGFLPFEATLTEDLRFGQDNSIVVSVDNSAHSGLVPDENIGWRNVGGILREVRLIATSPVYLDPPRIVAEPDADGGGRVTVAVVVHNESGSDRELRVGLDLVDRHGGLVGRRESEPSLIPAGDGQALTVEYSADRVAPWSPEDPALYTVRLEVHGSDGRALDGREHVVGFRRIEARGTDLLLNGKPLYLTGFNRHEDSARTDMATDLVQARQDLLDMKAMGANFVRLCHYPHHPGELDLCDELGLLAFAEIPLYWWKGREEGEEKYRAKLETCRRQLDALVSRDRNHPSVIVWSVSNETHEDRAGVTDGNDELIRRVKSLDPTRLVTHASMYWMGERRAHRHFAEDDILSLNAYPSHGAIRRTGSSLPADRAAEVWRRELADIHDDYPGKPILVTEFGYPCCDGVYGNAFGEDAQTAALEAEAAGMAAPYVAGVTVWCYADHQWPPLDLLQHGLISQFGVVTRDRRPKLAARGTIQRLFADLRRKRADGDAAS